jgi:carboxyl-terminal processing protease
MKRLCNSLVWVISFCCCFVVIYAQDLLKLNDVSKIMSQILEQHVDKKMVTTKVIQEALTNYINQFDPQRIYLLQDEVDLFTHLSPDRLQRLVDDYQQQRFTIFQELNQIVQAAIKRSRQLRQTMEASPTDFFREASQIEAIGVEENKDFAKSPDELTERIVEHFAMFLNSQRRRYGESAINQRKATVVQAYETLLRESENPYIYQDQQGQPLPLAEQENLFTIHILKALAKSLDAHTSFYQANEAYDLRVRLQKEFQGIGLVLKETPEGAIVSKVLPGGPAAKSGLIKEEDILLEVDGTSVLDLSFDKVMDLLHNGTQEDVKLVFKRKEEKDKENIYSVKLRRETIILNNDRVDVKSIPFGNGIIGVITLYSFYQGGGITSEEDVRRAIRKLEAEGNLRGLILDLRSNTGGFLSQAVKVAGLFITNGVIVISKYADGEQRFYRDVDGKTIFDGPLIVLTSKTTASAAEIVAQALQDYGVALIVGDEHTYGKGTIQTQTITDNQSSSYFKVTVGKYYTVSGKTPQKEGVKADIVVPSHWNQEKIGEEYLDSVEGDKIASYFEDNLKDVPASVRTWYLKYYIPKLQHPKTTWRRLLSTLRKNSEQRIANNKDYQFYLKGNKGEIVENQTDDEIEEVLLGVRKTKDYGVDDLQLNEAVNIIKDMIVLHAVEAANHQ